MANLAENKEQLMIVDVNGNATGNLQNRSVAHQLGLLHNEVYLWIFRRKKHGNGFEILLQRRSPNKKFGPNKLGICAGHVVGTEPILDAMKREANEELGIDVTKFDMKFLSKTYDDFNPLNKHFSYSFFIFADIPLSKFTVQSDELSGLVYYDYEKFKEMIKVKDNDTVFDYVNLKKYLDFLDDALSKV